MHLQSASGARESPPALVRWRGLCEGRGIRRRQPRRVGGRFRCPCERDTGERPSTPLAFAAESGVVVDASEHCVEGIVRARSRPPHRRRGGEPRRFRTGPRRIVMAEREGSRPCSARSLGVASLAALSRWRRVGACFAPVRASPPGGVALLLGGGVSAVALAVLLVSVLLVSVVLAVLLVSVGKPPRCRPA